MKINRAADDGAVSDQVLRVIVDKGFFETPGSLAKARAACAELLFARSVIEAQTVKIAALDSASAVGTHLPIS